MRREPQRSVPVVDRQAHLDEMSEWHLLREILKVLQQIEINTRPSGVPNTVPIDLPTSVSVEVG